MIQRNLAATPVYVCSPWRGVAFWVRRVVPHGLSLTQLFVQGPVPATHAAYSRGCNHPIPCQLCAMHMLSGILVADCSYNLAQWHWPNGGGGGAWELGYSLAGPSACRGFVQPAPSSPETRPHPRPNQPICKVLALVGINVYCAVCMNEWVTLVFVVSGTAGSLCPLCKLPFHLQLRRIAPLGKGAVSNKLPCSRRSACCSGWLWLLG